MRLDRSREYYTCSSLPRPPHATSSFPAHALIASVPSHSLVVALPSAPAHAAAATSSTLTGSASVSAIAPGAFSAMDFTSPLPRSFTSWSPYCFVTRGGFTLNASPP
eukprot:7403-Pelagococcus_subviridis.AAC.6